MASISITNGSAQQIGLPPGTPVTFTTTGSSIGILIGYTQGGAAAGPTVVTVSSTAAVNWTWPGVFVGNYGAVVLYITSNSATAVTMTYPS